MKIQVANKLINQVVSYSFSMILSGLIQQVKDSHLLDFFLDIKL